MTEITHGDGPGVIRVARNARTRSVIKLVECQAAGIPMGKYALRCDLHGTTIPYFTQAEAARNMGYPERWCEQCRPLAAAYSRR